MIGQFPWDPFPHGEADPSGDDPLLARLYRACVEGADAYRAVRAAVRREQGVLRVGNRFVPDGRYREVAFVALGRAANSMALAVLHVFGDRVTQGFVAAPEEPPAAVPFRSEIVGDGWGGDAAAAPAVEAARDIAGGLRESDLFLLLISPGAIRSLLLPPPGLDAAGLAGVLRSCWEQGRTGREVDEVARVLGDGGVGGRLLSTAVGADVQTLLVDRGDGAVAVGGGPTFPVTDAERDGARATLDRCGLTTTLPRETLDRLKAPQVPSTVPERRPVVVAGPAEALRGAGDAVFDKGWTGRVGVLGLRERPDSAARTFLERVEAVIGTRPTGDSPRSKGLVVFATTTLDLPEGVPEGEAAGRFLAGAFAGLRRREMSVALFRTSGPTAPGRDFAGAVIGAPGDPTSRSPPSLVRPLRMRGGITDVGLVAAAALPAPAEATRRSG